MASYWNETSINAGNTYVVASPLTVYALRAFGDALPERWLQFFDATTTPTAGDVPLISRPLSGYTEMDFGAGGRRFSNGLVIAVSSTKMTYTADGTALMRFDVQAYGS